MREVTKEVAAEVGKQIVAIMRASKDPKTVQLALKVYAKVATGDDDLIVIDPDHHPAP